MLDNIEYSKEWLVQEIIKTDFKEKETNDDPHHFLPSKLVFTFVKLNERGGF